MIFSKRTPRDMHTFMTCAVTIGTAYSTAAFVTYVALITAWSKAVAK